MSTAQFTERFEREARAIAQLNHPHICQLYGVGPDYLVMEYVEGAPLKGPLPVEKAVEYAGQILDALDDARSDLFSFGCMLYEMLTGARAFGGASAASMIAAILEREAPSVATVAPQLERIVRRCLAKDPFLRHTIVSLSLQTSTPDENNGGPKWTCHPQSPRQSREVQKEM